MYHYVRELEGSDFPDVKGLEFELFKEQLDYIGRHFQVIDAAHLIAATRDGEPLPDRAALLTFDDGYSDHYTYVLPELVRRGFTGCFFPPVCTVREHRILDVNKIHFVLASCREKGLLIEELRKITEEHGEEYGLKSHAEYWAEWAHPGRYDPADVIFIKRMLQRAWPLDLRRRAADRLFNRFVSADQVAFAQELYMSEAQLRDLLAVGMYVGSHGYDHFWLDSLGPEDQEREVDLSLRFLDKLGAPTRDWIMCYPYGGHDDSLLGILRSRRCAVGLTTEIGVADLREEDPLALRRLDTNDLPKDRTAPALRWPLPTAPGRDVQRGATA